jgi:FAD/FMN-containing dehydrogenase
MGIRGLLLDALQSVRMVTADGKLVTASRTQNSGLFWAIGGAGNNFGVVTSATFKIYDATNDAQAMVASMIFPAVANKSFWEVLQSFDENLPPGLAITALGFYYRQFNMVGI